MIKINKDKRIGKVIFIVEGKKYEPKIIKTIFENILGYTVYKEYSTKDMLDLRKNEDKYNQIIIIHHIKPQVATIISEEEFISEKIELLKKYQIDYENSAIYYIFDRDPDSNSLDAIKKVMAKFNNSREDNEFDDIHGLFLISYPCLEAFVCTANKDSTCFKNAKEIKKYVKAKKYIISEELIIPAMEEFINILFSMNLEFREEYLDDFKEFNLTILDKEEVYYKNTTTYKTLSMFIVSLIDLGIIIRESKYQESNNE